MQKTSVLFIDEAHRIAQRFWPGGHQHHHVLHGRCKERKASIYIRQLKQEMEGFIAVNDGFRRRVRHTIHMSDYIDGRPGDHDMSPTTVSNLTPFTFDRYTDI